MKKLRLKRETIGILTEDNLAHVQGGASVATIVVIRTRLCPLPTHGCTGGPCVETILTSGTSVINPG